MNLRFSKKNLKDARRFCAVTAIDKLNGGINQMDCGGRRAIGHISPAWPWTEPAWGRRFDRGLANCRRRRCSCSSNGYNAASPQAPALAFPCPCFWPLQRPLWPRPPYLRVGGRRKRIFHFSLSLSNFVWIFFFPLKIPTVGYFNLPSVWQEERKKFNEGIFLKLSRKCDELFTRVSERNHFEVWFGYYNWLVFLAIGFPFQVHYLNIDLI